MVSERQETYEVNPMSAPGCGPDSVQAAVWKEGAEAEPADPLNRELGKLRWPGGGQEGAEARELQRVP